MVVALSGEAKALKVKEAEEYRDKAKKAMQKGLFSKPDPLAASTYYKRAADAYRLCGEHRLERLYRINSADCQSTSRKIECLCRLRVLLRPYLCLYLYPHLTLHLSLQTQ